MENELLIALVREREPLWDRTHLDHHNRNVLKKLWKEVAQEMNLTSEKTLYKWRNLRDTFRKVHRVIKNDNAQHAPKWQHYSDMLFIQDQIIPRKSLEDTGKAQCLNLCASNTGIDDGDFAQENSKGDNEDSLLATSGKKRRIDNLEDSEQNKKKHNDEMVREQEPLYDDDHHFAHSIIPFLRSVLPKRKLYLRTKIHELLIQEQALVEEHAPTII